MSLLIHGVQLAGCLLGQVSPPLIWDASIIENADSEASMRTTTPNWCGVLSGGVEQGKSRNGQYLGTCTPSGSRKSPQQCNSDREFFAQSFEVVTESERPIQLYPDIRWDWTGWQ